MACGQVAAIVRAVAGITRAQHMTLARCNAATGKGHCYGHDRRNRPQPADGALGRSGGRPRTHARPGAMGRDGGGHPSAGATRAAPPSDHRAVSRAPAATHAAGGRDPGTACHAAATIRTTPTAAGSSPAHCAAPAKGAPACAVARRHYATTTTAGNPATATTKIATGPTAARWGTSFSSDRSRTRPQWL